MTRVEIKWTFVVLAAILCGFVAGQVWRLPQESARTSAWFPDCTVRAIDIHGDSTFVAGVDVHFTSMDGEPIMFLLKERHNGSSQWFLKQREMQRWLIAYTRADTVTVGGE